MRIIAGEFKGRTLRAPAGSSVRPTSDRLRETLFNVLAPHITGASVLDAFAGTGAVGLEAISRGARHATFVERDPHALKALEANVAACRASDACTIVQADFIGAGARLAAIAPFEFAFLDPPYAFDAVEPALAAVALCMAPGGLVVFEHGRRREPPPSIAGLTRYRVLKAGDSALSFYRAHVVEP